MSGPTKRPRRASPPLPSCSAPALSEPEPATSELRSAAPILSASPLWTHLLGWLADTDISLGDERLDARWHRLAASSLTGQGPSVAALAGDGGDADVRAAERFVANDRADPVLLRSALYALTLRAAAEQHVRSLVVAFDPTELSFSHQPQKRDRIQVGNHKRDLGYTWLNAATFAPATGCLLGVLHQALLVDGGPDDQHEVDYAPGLLDPALEADAARNFKQQLSVYARLIDKRVPSDIALTFVADTDFDDGLTLRHMRRDLSSRCRFIVRGDAQRVVQIAPAAWVPKRRRTPSAQRALPDDEGAAGLLNVYLDEVLDAIPKAPFRRLPLDARGRAVAPGARPARVAQLQIGAVPIRLARKSERGMRFQEQESPIWLNLVVVTEQAPPAGKKGIVWLLLTDMPIETQTEREAVVDGYLCRWRIEEFFRTTKDVLQIERSELEDPQDTARWLFFVTLKAMLLDALRQEVGLQAGAAPTAAQRKKLRAGKAEAEREEQARVADPARPLPSREERTWMVLSLLAHYGHWTGWYQGSLGNYVLCRGLPRLLGMWAGGRFRWLARGEAPSPRTGAVPAPS